MGGTSWCNPSPQHIQRAAQSHLPTIGGWTHPVMQLKTTRYVFGANTNFFGKLRNCPSVLHIPESAGKFFEPRHITNWVLRFTCVSIPQTLDNGFERSRRSESAIGVVPIDTIAIRQIVVSHFDIECSDRHRSEGIPMHMKRWMKNDISGLAFKPSVNTSLFVNTGNHKRQIRTIMAVLRQGAERIMHCFPNFR